MLMTGLRSLPYWKTCDLAELVQKFGRSGTKKWQNFADDPQKGPWYNCIVRNWTKRKALIFRVAWALRFSAFLHTQIQWKGVKIMVKQLAKGKERLTNAYWSAVGMASVALLSVSPVLAADTIWSRFSTILKDIYGEVVAISTIVAVTVGAIALLIRMISRNNRAVEEATNWLKRIVVTWIILNSLGFIVAYLQPLIQGGNYSP